MELCSIFRLVIALNIFIGSSVVLAQSTEEVVDQFVSDQLLNNVVQIQVGNNNRSNPGLGFIFGRDGNIIWIATAAHVVFPDFGRPLVVELKPAPGITIQRRGDSRQWRPTNDPEVAFGGDIAFVAVDMPLETMAPDMWREPVVVVGPEVGDAVRIAGMPSNIIYGDNVGRFIGYDSEGRMQIENLAGRPGQSGAPVATKNGFIGMYTSSAGDRVIPIAVIKNAAVLAHRPWQLSMAPQIPVSVRVCLDVVGGDRSDISLNGPAGIRRLDELGCVNTKSGTNKLVSSMYTYCEPSEYEIGRQPEQTVRAKCFINPVGIWQSQAHGGVRISRDGERFWRIEGLNMSPFGWIEGNISGALPNLVIDATTQFGLVVTGQLILEQRHLSGRILVGGTPYRLELTR